MSDVSNVCFRGKKSVWFDVSPNSRVFCKISVEKMRILPRCRHVHDRTCDGCRISFAYNFGERWLFRRFKCLGVKAGFVAESPWAKQQICHFAHEWIPWNGFSPEKCLKNCLNSEAKYYMLSMNMPSSARDSQHSESSRIWGCAWDTSVNLRDEISWEVGFLVGTCCHMTYIYILYIYIENASYHISIMDKIRRSPVEEKGSLFPIIYKGFRFTSKRWLALGFLVSSTVFWYHNPSITHPQHP